MDRHRFARLETVWGDNEYRNWVSERTFAWRGRDRRHSKAYEWRPESSEAWARISAIGQMLRWLMPDEQRRQSPFMYRQEAAAELSG